MEDKLPPLWGKLIETVGQTSTFEAKREDKIGWERT